MPSHDASWYADPEFDDNGHRYDSEPLRDVDAEIDAMHERKAELLEKVERTTN